MAQAAKLSTAGNESDALTPEQRESLRAWVMADGVHCVAEAARTGREVVARGCAGLGIRRGSAALLRAALACRNAGSPHGQGAA